MSNSSHFEDRRELIEAYDQPLGTVSRYCETDPINAGFLQNLLRESHDRVSDAINNWASWSKQQDDQHRERSLALQLICEEFFELMTALLMEEPDADALKEAADLGVVVEGMCLMFGWDYDEARKRVHASNMSKMVDGKPVKNEDGKVVKGPNYMPPNLGDLV